MDQGMETLLNNIGVPVELFKGSLQIQSAPAALRLFESSWTHLVHNLNGYIAYIMKRLGQLLSWESAEAKMEQVTHADDMQRQMAKLQLLMGGQISKQTGLRSVNVDFFDETRRQMQEQRFEAEQQNKLQEQLEQEAQMAQMGQPQQGGGQPGQPGQGGGDPSQGLPPGSAATIAAQPTIPNKPTTPNEMLAKAQELSQQILSMPESQKDSELIQLKRTDPTLHALVKSQIEDIRRTAQTQGGAMLMNQQFNKQGGSVLE
jgi:hypothetical protein